MKIEKGNTLTREEYECGFLCDIIHHEGGAEVLARYGTDFYEGVPCVTVNSFGEGKAYYIGTQPEQTFLEELVDKICGNCHLEPLYALAEGMEMTLRVSDRAEVVFAINHNKEESWIDFGEEKLENLLNGEELTGRISITAGDVIVTKYLTEWEKLLTMQGKVNFPAFSGREMSVVFFCYLYIPFTISSVVFGRFMA